MAGDLAKRGGPSKANGAAPAEPQTRSAAPATAADRFASDFDFLLANGTVDEKLFSAVLKAVSGRQAPKKKVVLCLVTYGGIANDAFRIGRLLQLIFDEVVVFVPSFCKSAGTLIACAGHSIVLTPFGELGPLDVQLAKRDELFERRSGLLTNYALQELKEHAFGLFEHFMLSIKARGPNISFKMASEIAGKVTGEIMRNVYDHVNIESIGEDARNLSVASEYCARLASKSDNLRKGCIERLVHGYVSHDFVIDVEEARTLFRRVEIPTDTLYRLLEEHQQDLMVPTTGDAVVKILTPSSSIEGGHQPGENGHAQDSPPPVAAVNANDVGSGESAAK